MQINEVGFPIYDVHDVMDIIYSQDFDILKEILVTSHGDIEKFNQNAKEFDLQNLLVYANDTELQTDDVDTLCQNNWFMPEKYKNIDLYQFLIQKCTNKAEITRVEEELEAFTKYNLCNLLKYTIFLVDHMREHNYIWGVGRGSSVASFVLYLIGIHKINPITYDLEWQEFLK
tara:strand:- start:1052 stop:1570 length:519 start_codon:yes stop_codon:yes gene_type:complete